MHSRGERWDFDLGLYYLRARYYNPQTGRFMSRDPEDGKPFDPKTLHKYLYAGGDPVSAADPTGRDLVSDVITRVRSFIRTTLVSSKIAEFTACYLRFIADATTLTYISIQYGTPFSGNLAFALDRLKVCLELASYL